MAFPRFNIFSRFNLTPKTTESGGTVEKHAQGSSTGTSTAVARTRVLLDGREGSIVLKNEIMIAASDSSYEDKRFADYVCTGAEDERTILTAVTKRRSKLHDVNGTIIFSEEIENSFTPMAGKLVLRFARGMFNIFNTFQLTDVDIIGAGSDTTIFEFKRPNISPTAMYKSLLEMKVKTTNTVTLDSFMISAGGVIHLIYDDPTVFTIANKSNTFNVKNVFATNKGGKSNTFFYTNSVGKIVVEVAYPVNTVRPKTIPLVYLNMIDCKVWDTDFSGFYIYGDCNNDIYARAFKDIYIKNCHAEKCGVRDFNSIVAGFNLLVNLTAENLRIHNSTSTDNWHSGFYIDDAKTRKYTAGGRTEYGSGVVYNLFMENCKAYSNGRRSINFTNKQLYPYCSGFVINEFSDGTASLENIPQFLSFDSNGVITVTAPDYPAELRTARGPYKSRDGSVVAFGNLLNCMSVGNFYTGYLCTGFKHNKAEFGLINCYAARSQYAIVADGQDGLYIEYFVSDNIKQPSIRLKNVDTINIQYMRIVDPVMSQFITFKDMSGYANLPIGALQFIEVIE